MLRTSTFFSHRPMKEGIKFMQWMLKIRSIHYTNTEEMDRAVNKINKLEHEYYKSPKRSLAAES